MNEHTGGSVGNILLAFLAGAAAGGLVVALTTPKRGEELRADMKGFGNRMKEKTQEALQRAGGVGREMGEALTENINEVKNEVGESLQDRRG